MIKVLRSESRKGADYLTDDWRLEQWGNHDYVLRSQIYIRLACDFKPWFCWPLQEGCDWSFATTPSRIVKGWDEQPFIQPCAETQDEKILLVTVAERPLTHSESTYRMLQRMVDRGGNVSPSNRKRLQRYKRRRRSKRGWINCYEAEEIEHYEQQNSHGKTASLVVRLETLNGYVSVLKPEEDETYVEVFSWGGYEKMTLAEYNQRSQRGTIVDIQRVKADYEEAEKRRALRFKSIGERERFLPVVKMLRDVKVVDITPCYDGFWFKGDFLFYDEQSVDSCRQYVIKKKAEFQYEAARKEIMKRYQAAVQQFGLDKNPDYSRWLEIDRDEVVIEQVVIDRHKLPRPPITMTQKVKTYAYNPEDLRRFILDIEEIRQLLEQSSLMYRDFLAMRRAGK